MYEKKTVELHIPLCLFFRDRELQNFKQNFNINWTREHEYLQLMQ